MLIDDFISVKLEEIGALGTTSADIEQWRQSPITKRFFAEMELSLANSIGTTSGGSLEEVAMNAKLYEENWNILRTMRAWNPMKEDA